MQNLSDDELDNLFRKAAEDLNPVYEPAHWNELDQKLTDAGQKTSDPKGWLWKGIITLFLIGSVVVVVSNLDRKEHSSGVAAAGSALQKGLPAESAKKVHEAVSGSGMTNSADTRKITAATESTTTVNDKQTPDGAPAHYVSDQTRMPRSKTDQSIAAVYQNHTAKPRTKPGSEAADRDRYSDENAMSGALNHGANPTADIVNSSSQMGEAKSPTDPATHRLSAIPEKNTKETDEVTSDDQEALQAKSVEGNGQKITTASLAEASDSLDSDRQAETPETTKTSEETKRDGSTPRFSIKLALAPDYSSVRYSSFTKAGTNFGIMLEYRIGSRWSVSTGALSSRKIYTADDVEYNGHKADRTNGDCRIIDIPVNIFYHFKSARSLSFYSSLGFSSYIMQTEEYDFHVRYSGNSYSYSRRIKGENNELFSVLNISAGVQKQFTPRLAVQVEPFVKQSIKGIGEGDLSLSSVGAFLNVRYTIIK